MADSSSLQEQRKALEKLAALKKEMAGMDIASQSKEIDVLQKKIVSLTESLVKMGMQYTRIEEFYEAFVRGNAQINEINTSISGTLLGNINKLAAAANPALEKFLTPIESLKTGAENVVQLLQNSIKTATNLETYSLAERRENTRGFVEENAQLTQNLVKAYGDLIKNEGNLGTAKFQTLNVEKEMADMLLYIDRLDKMKFQLARGYYGQLRTQAGTILEILNDLRLTHETHSNINDLASKAIQNAKEEKEAAEARVRIENEILQIRHAQQLSWDKELEAINKKAQTLRRLDATSAFMQLPSETEIQKEVQIYLDAERKIEEESKRAHQKAIDDRSATDAKYLEDTRKQFYLNWIEQSFLQEKNDEEIKKRLENLKKIRQQDFNAELERIQKIRDARTKLEEKIQKDKQKQYLTELKYNSKLLEDKQKKEKELLDNTTKYLDGIITKLPGGGLLSMSSKLGIMFQLISIAIGSILYLIFRWDSVTANIAEKLSITRDNATATAKAAGAFAANMSLANIKGEQVVNGLIALSEGFGGLDLATSFTAGNNAAKQLVASGALLTDTFGLSGQELAGMTDAATAMGMSLSSSTIMAVNMSRGIMSATKLMQSLASLSPKILTGFKGSNAELIGMVTKMKLLGVEANNIISSNDKLLDIESSISSAFEAQVATGANIDIDKLMSLQMSGNYQGVINEQLRTLQQANYLNMNPLGQELLASGLGLDRETASQMMLRKILVDKVGLTDELIEKRQKEGQLLENDIKLAEKQGKITKLEADQLKKISEEYDNKTMQEKMMREFNDSVTALSSSLVELTDVLRMFTDGIGKMTAPVKESLFSLGSMGTTIMSVLGGAAMVGSLIFMGKRGYPAVKAMANTAKSMFSGGSSVGSSATTAAASSATGGSTAGMAQGSAVQAASKGGKFGKFFGGMKGAGALGLIGAGIDFYGNMQSGQSTSEAATRAALTGGLGIAGGLLGSLIPIPGVGTFVGGTLGGFAGSMLGDLIYADSSSQTKSIQAQRIQAKQQSLKNYSGANDSSYTSAAISASDLLTAITTMSAKIDTTNSLLNTMNAKPSEISVELDGEKVGKAVMNYSSGVIDRGRTVGNSYGGNRDQNATRVRK